MKDKFDKILSNKIKDTFENREVSYNPEHWEMLVAKKGKKKRRILFLWRFAGAALIFIVAGSLGKFLFSNSEPIPSKENEIKIVEDDKNSSKKDIINKTYDNTNARDDLRISEIDTTSSVSFQKTNQNKLNTNTIANSKNSTDRDSKPKNSSEIAHEIVPQKDSLKIKTHNNNIFDLAIENKKITQNDIKKDTLENTKTVIKNKKDIEELVAKHGNEINRKKLNNKSVKIGVNVSSMVNSIKENQNSDIGFSSGVTVEIPVLKKFDISTGVLYTNQKFNLDNPNILAAAEDIVSNGGVQLTSKEATMKGIEIPINVKYNFTISKKNLFVSAGVSSTSYIQENVSSDYLVNTKIATNALSVNGDEIVEYNLTQSSSTIETNQNPDAFNFASMLNLSFGMEFPMSNKRQSIVIEPYFKYSLAPITHQKVNYTNAGFYLRYNFSLKKE